MTDGQEWQVLWTSEGWRSLKHVPPRVLPAIVNFVNERLVLDPWRTTHALHSPLDNYRSGRVGSYRVMVKIDTENKVIYVVKAAYHADVYR